MLSCRNGPRLRLLALLGLVLLGIGVVNVVFAASDPVNTTPEAALTFPFMSVDLNQSKTLANAFMFQMRLFMGATGQDTSGGVSSVGGGFAAVRYLAIMAVMIGTLLILFFKKYQRPMVILSWLLLVLISVFVPLGSKLIFYPIKAEMPPSLSSVGESKKYLKAIDHNGKPCTENPAGCGFTPQLVAIHLGSTLQMIVSDVFRSAQWQGLLERQAAATRLKQLPDFQMSPAWLEAGKDFFNKCRDANMDWASLLPSQTSQNNSQAPNDKDKVLTEQETLGDMFKDYYNIYYGGGNNAGGIMPPMVVLPEKTEDAKALGWDDDQIKSYENGMTVLFNNFGSDSGAYDSVAFEGNAQAKVKPIKDAMDNMPLLFSAPDLAGGGSYYNHAVPLSIFFMRYSDLGQKIAVRRCYVEDKTATGSSIIQKIKDGWNGIPTAEACVQNYGGVEMSTGATTATENRVFYDPNFHKRQFNELYAALGVNSKIPQGPMPEQPAWNKLAQAFDNESVRKMPVGYGIPTRLDEKTWLLGSAVAFPDATVKAENVKTQLTCTMIGRPLVQSAIDALSTKPASGKEVEGYFDNLVTLLEGTGTVPTRLSWSDVTSADAKNSGFSAEKDQMIQYVIIRLNEQLRKAEENNRSSDPLSDEDRRTALVYSLVELMEQVTRDANDMMDNDARANAKEDASTPRIVGWNALSSFGGGAAIEIAKWLTDILAKFTGPLAVAYIYFIDALINMTLLALIVMTPFLFLLGLVIPTTAAGVLAISVMSILVLKFVPVTLILLNALGGMMYDMIPLSIGSNADFARDLLIIAMSGMYMSAVGLTFFLMFKLGDPAAFLGRLVALDAASKKLADSGWDVTKAVAAGAVAIAAGGLTGGVAGMKDALRQRAVQAGLPPEVANVIDGPPVEKKGKGGGGPEDPNDPNGSPDGQGGAGSDEPGADTAKATESMVDLMGKPIDGEGTTLSDRLQTGMFEDGGEGITVDGKQLTLSKDEDGNRYVTDEQGNRFMAADASGKLLSQPTIMGSDAGHALMSGGSGSGAPQTFADVKEAQEQARLGKDMAVDTRPQTPSNTPAGQTSSRMDTAAAARQGGQKTAQGRTLGDRANYVQSEALGTEIARQKTAIANRLADPNLQLAERANLEAYSAKLDELGQMDDAQLAQGGLAKAQGTLAELDRAMSLRVGADKVSKNAFLAAARGAGKGFLSGGYGSLSAVFASGGGSIPFVGPAMREIANEWYQAPERARAVDAAGGYSKWRGLKADAERMKFYKQEMGPLTSGFEYQQTMGAGAFQAQYEVARQAASEAVARTRSNYLAIEASGGVKNAFSVKDPVTGEYTESLSGLGSIEAAAKLAATRAEAVGTQGKTVEIKYAERKNGILTGKTLTEKVTMTPRLLATMQGQLGVKAAGGKINDMLEAHMSISDKLYARGGNWAKTQGMEGNASAARTFMMADIDSDYVTAARIKMYQGKSKNMEDTAYAKAINEATYHDKRVKADAIRELELEIQNAGTDGAAKLYAQRIQVDPKLAAKYRVTGRGEVAYTAALTAKAMDDVAGKLNLQPTFDAAQAKGRLTMFEKVINAQFKNEQAEMEAITLKAMTGGARAAGVSGSFLKPRVLTAENGMQMQMDSAFSEYVNAISAGLKKSGAAKTPEELSMLTGQMVKALTTNFDDLPKLFSMVKGEFTEVLKTGATLNHGERSLSYVANPKFSNDAVEALRKDTRLPKEVRDNAGILAEIIDKDGRYKVGDPDAGEERMLGLIFDT